MKLPNAENAVIQQAKLVDYLLDPSHLYGGAKARWLLVRGYRADSWQRRFMARSTSKWAHGGELDTKSSRHFRPLPVNRYRFVVFGKSILEPTIRD